MGNILFQSYNINERSYVAFIKRELHNLVRPHFNETRTGEIDIVISEMCSNLIKYAHKGELLYRLSFEKGKPVFEVICIDNGVWITDLVNSMKDGVSSQNSLGQGLGSIHRLSNLSQIYSLPNWGTILYSKFCPELSDREEKQKVLVRCINVAKPGEVVSGDGMYVKHFPDKTIVILGDGLGHGQHAKDAVDKAIAAFTESISSDPAQIIKEMHQVKRTRGLVATVAVIDHSNKTCETCGVGNIHMRLQRGLEYKSYIANNGIIGLNIPSRLENANYEIDRLQSLILCSDGIKTKWDLMRYPGIMKCDPMMLAAVLYKDQARKTDDMTIVITKVV